MKNGVLVTLVLISLTVLPTLASAGGGCGGGRRGAAEGESSLAKKHRLARDYETAQRIFDGKIPLRPRVSIMAKEQAEIFAEYTARIPQTSADYARLTEVTGRLSREQVEAVKHYLDTRYPAPGPSVEDSRLARFQREKAAMEKAQ